jgi:predicted secreted protein
MTPMEIFLSYVIAWWMIFFMALPFGATPSEQPQRGHAESAPAKPRLWTKAAITSVIAALVVWAFHWFVTSGIMTLRP